MRPSPIAIAIVLVTVVAAGCPALTNSYRLTNAKTLVEGAAYIDDGDVKHTVDVFAPEGAAGAPLVVFIHGGTWKGGDRDYYGLVTGLYGNVGRALAEEDIVTAVPSYRLWPGASMDQMLDDVAAAIRWARTHARETGADPDKLFLAGHSAGGHLVALLATKPDALAARGIDPTWIRGVVVLSGVLDLERTIQTTKDEAILALWPTAAEARAASPLRYVGAATTPSLFMIGGLDYKGLRRDFFTLRSLRLEGAELVEVPNFTHSDMVLRIGTEQDPITPRVGRFVRSVLAAQR